MKATSNDSSRKAGKDSGGQVICGTDFSNHAIEAVDAAAAIAGRLRLPLVLAHVVDNSALIGGTEKLRAQFVKSAQARLVHEAARLRDRDVEVVTEVREGRPETELARLAARPAARLLVTASLGHIAVSRILIGSVAERTAEAAPIPTLVVRAAKPLIEWAGGRRALNVFVAGDFTASADAAIGWVKALRRVGPCRVVLGHVDWPVEERRRLGIHSPTPCWQNPPEVEEALTRDLRFKLRTLLGDTSARVRVTPSWGAPDYHLLEMARQEQADLIVVGSHQRRGWSRLAHPSVSRGLLHHAPMNVACVPASYGAGASMAPIPEFLRVLVTTDFSERGNHAIPFAFAALAPGGTVRLVHVLPPFELPGPLVPHYERKARTKKDHARLAAELTARLRALVPQETMERGQRCEAAVLEGRDAATTICQEAERFSADLVCIGSHGHSGLVAALLGSVAQKVVARSRRPVLVVRMSPA
jgi:nucleotide-binding universal stress UspA family protein